MADPAAVLAEALILLLRAMAAGGAVLLMDDVHWADEDTISVLSYLADSVEQLPLSLIMTARTEPLPPDRVERLSAVPSIRRAAAEPAPRQVRLEKHFAPRSCLPSRPETVDQLVTAVDGLPLVLDEFVRQLREGPPDGFDMKHTTLAAAVQKRLRSLPADARVALDAMSVVGETDSELLAAITGLDEARLSIAIHDAVSSTLLVPASTPLGVTWRHPLMRDAVRDLLLPLERQSLARRAADQLANAADPSDGQLRQAAEMYELAGYPDQAARKLIQAAHAAVRNAALDVAEQHLAAAQALTGTMPEAALEVLIERIETLTLAGRAGDGYHSGIAALQSLAAGDARPLLVATARAAYAGGLGAEGAELLARLQEVAEPADADLVVLRAHSALVDRQAAEAIQLGQLAATRALDEGRFELACEALLIAGTAAQRRDIDLAARVLHQALALSEAHQSSIWQVQALAELGVLDVAADSDPARFYQARERATAAGMLGTVVLMDSWIGRTTFSRDGSRAAYPIYLAAGEQARQLQLINLYAVTRAHLAECVLFADDRPLPGRSRPATPSELDDLIAEAIAAGTKSGRAPWVRSVYGLRAWLHGDNSTAIRLIDESLRNMQDEWHIVPWWGVGALLRVVADTDPEEAFGSPKLIGHHANWAARRYGAAIWELRNSRSPSESIAEADYFVRHTPFHRHMLRTIIAPVVYQAGHGGGGRGLATRGRRVLQRGRRTRPAASGPPDPRVDRRQSPEGFNISCPTAPGQTRDHRSRDRDSATCQRRAQQR